MDEAYGDARRAAIPRDEDGHVKWPLKESLRDIGRSCVSYSPLTGPSAATRLKVLQ